MLHSASRAQFHCGTIIAWMKSEGLGARTSTRKYLLSQQISWIVLSDCSALLLVLLRPAACPSVSPQDRAALWPWLCGGFMRAFLQLVEGGGYVGWSSEKKGAGFLFSLWLRHVGEYFCGIFLINNLFTLTPEGVPGVGVRIQSKRLLTLEISSDKDQNWQSLGCGWWAGRALPWGVHLPLCKWRHRGQGGPVTWLKPTASNHVSRELYNIWAWEPTEIRGSGLLQVLDSLTTGQLACSGAACLLRKGHCSG